MTCEEMIEIAEKLGCHSTGFNVPFKIKYHEKTLIINYSFESHIKTYWIDYSRHILNFSGCDDKISPIVNNDIDVDPVDLEGIIKHNIQEIKKFEQMCRLHDIERDFK